MQRKGPRLREIAIAAPCSADWEQMPGSDQVRRCAQCERHVYNLTALTSAEAETLLAWTGDQLCARLYMRPDGTVLTADCPVGLRTAASRARRVVRARWAALGVFAAGLLGFAAMAEEVPSSHEARPFAESERLPPPPGVEPARELRAETAFHGRNGIGWVVGRLIKRLPNEGG